MLEDVGPGTERLGELRAGDGLWLLGPLGHGFAPPRDGRRPLLVGGGVGIAPLAIWQDALGGATRRCSGFRDAAHAARRRAAARRAGRDRRRLGRPPGLSPSCCCAELGRDPHVEVYACGPPPMLEAVRALCAEHDVPAQLALESGMACGFGACFGCVVPTATATCGCASTARCSTPVDAASIGRVIASAASSSPHPIVNASGTFDAIAARRAFGDALLERFPFAAFVSKTVTLAPRQGNPPPRLCELPGGDDQLDRAARTRAWTATSRTTCRSSPSCRCR